MADYGAQDTSTTTLGANQFPISEAWTPNAGFSAVEGGTQTTDSGGKKSAPIRTEVKDGSNLVEGATTDAAVTGDTSGSLSAKLRGLSKIFTDIWDSVNHRIKVDGSGVTQPVSVSSLPLPTGASTSAKQPALGTAGTASSDVLTVQGIASMTALKTDGSGVTQPVSGTFWQATQPVSGTFWQATQPVSLSSLPSLVAGSALIGSVEMVDSGGTNKAAIDAAGNQAIKGGFAEQSGLSAGALNADLVASTDVSAYKGFSLQVAGAWSGTLTFQGSNDNTNFQTIFAYSLTSNSTGIFTGTTTTNGLFANAVAFRYLRVRMTAYTSGTATGTLELYTQNLIGYANTSIAAAQSGVWTVQPGNTTNTTPWLISQSTSSTGTKTNVASSATNVTILASNASRKGAMIYNDSTQVLYLDLSGGIASSTSYSVQVPSQGFFELPAPAIYSGLITGIWASANGNARVTEFS